MPRSDKPKEVIARHDEAIDLERSRLAEYTLTRNLVDDKGQPLLYFVPGREPVRYYVRRIPRSLWLRYVDQGVNKREKCIRAFLVGVVRIEGLHDDSGNRILLEPHHTVETPAGEMAVFQDKDLDHVPVQDVYDIGSVAYYMGFLVGGRRGYYPLPPSAQYALESRVFQDAEWSPTARLPSSERRKGAPEGSAPKPPPSDSDGAEPTDATATESPTEGPPLQTQESEETF